MSEVTLKDMYNKFTWTHYKWYQKHNHNITKQNKTMCIFYGIYCITGTAIFHGVYCGGSYVAWWQATVVQYIDPAVVKTSCRLFCCLRYISATTTMSLMKYGGTRPMLGSILKQPSSTALKPMRSFGLYKFTHAYLNCHQNHVKNVWQMCLSIDKYCAGRGQNDK